jgi:hypothetical protein
MLEPVRRRLHHLDGHPPQQDDIRRKDIREGDWVSWKRPAT